LNKQYVSFFAACSAILLAFWLCYL